MAYEVLARKWRPQQFDQVVGQAHVVQTLRNTIGSNRLAHAYLFVGPRGIGKTSLARIFAKALNCVKGPTVTPCDACDACREIAAGTSLDVLEIDGASNTGVDQVRELRETVKYMPARGRYKIYLIDEVHMLSTPAFNALLKTLEEPPPHVKFFFATTEPQKILPTILSRCQRFDLRRIPVPLLVQRLGEIARSEGVEVAADALLAIARGAEGGLRDAESALDQLIAFCGQTITEADVLAVFGLAARQTLDALTAAVLAADIPALIRLVGELDAAGKDLQRLVVDLLEQFRNLLIRLYAPNAARALDLTAEQMEVLDAHARLTSADRVLRIVDILAETEDRLKYALSKRTLVETALIRCVRAGQMVPIDEVLARIEALGRRLGGAGGAGPATTPRREPAPPAQAIPAPAAAEPAPAVAAPAGGDELATLTAQWPQIIERVGKQAPLARGALLDSRPVDVRPDRVVIGFDPEFAESKKRLEAPRSLNATRAVLEQSLRRAVTVELRLLGSEAPAALPTDHAEGQNGAPAHGKREGSRPKRDWHQDPAVRRTLEAFNGSIVDVRE